MLSNSIPRYALINLWSIKKQELPLKPPSNCITAAKDTQVIKKLMKDMSALEPVTTFLILQAVFTHELGRTSQPLN
jgi:hypothetical protein